MGVALGTLLTQRLSLLESTQTSNGAGGYTETWAAVATTRGRVSDGGSGTGSRMEAAIASQQIGVELYEIVLNTETVDPAWRVEDEAGVQYEIVSLIRQQGYAIITGRRVDA